jgi:hypothetical protein
MLQSSDWPTMYLEMIPELRAKWPDVKGEFVLIPTEGENRTLWDEKRGYVEVHLRADATANVKMHEIGHVAACRMFPELSAAASTPQHELAAHLVELYVLGRTKEWNRRVDLQPQETALMIRRFTPALEPILYLGEAVRRALGGR